MESPQSLVRGPGEPRPSDAEIRATAPRHEPSPADGERVDAALAALAVADAEHTMRAPRAAAREPEPRRATWALHGGPPGGPRGGADGR
jgi:hypothetical protein